MSPRISIRLLSGQSDERLLALARGGHERAFEALVQRYRRPLLRFCRRTMRLSDARAEDVVQQSLLKAWMALAAGTEVRDFKPWLYSIVRNTALNALRAHGETNVALTDAVPARASADSELERRLEMQDALTHVAALPQAQREALFMTVFDGQSHQEVASALGITNGAVRGLLYRARTTLRGAAAALTPQPLIAWAAGSAGPSSERITEVSAGAGALGAGGLLAKGAVLAVTAGALATSAVVQLGPSVSHHRGARIAAASVADAHGAVAAQRALLAPRAGGATTSTRRASATVGAGAAASPARGGASHPGAGAAAPQNRSSTHRRQALSEDGSGAVSTTGPGSAPGAPSASAPSASAPTATTTTAEPTEPPPAPTQTQKQPPAEEPASGEPQQPGAAETDGALPSCPTTQLSSSETKSCDE